jgi:histidinol-phosphate aminotransferase
MRELLRDNIANLVPYRCARNDFTGAAEVYLDANENWQDFAGNKGRNRYPDPLCTAVRKQLEAVQGLPFSRTVVGNGSDEIIDNLFRMFCRPKADSVAIMSPTYGAYRVFADINDVRVDDIPLREDFSLDFPALEKFFASEQKSRTAEGRCKLLFVCSPNNPSGNAFPLEQIERLCTLFDGIVVLDEAYFDFSPYESGVTLQKRYPNLVVLRTLSKCWALANARIGICVADEEICSVMASMKYPYNVGGPAQEVALQTLSRYEDVRRELGALVAARGEMERALETVPCVRKVYHSDANFFLVKVSDAKGLYRYLAGNGIIVRNRSSELHCDNCLRITVGSAEENRKVVDCMKSFEGGFDGLQ